MAKKAASLGAFGFGSTLGSSTLTLDILEATHKKDNEVLAILLELLQVVAAAVAASVGGLTAITQTIKNTNAAAQSTSNLLAQFATRVQAGATAVGAISGGAQAGETILQGNIQKNLTRYQANVQLDEATQENTDQNIKQTEEELNQLIKTYEELIATAFKTPAEVVNAQVQALIQA